MELKAALAAHYAWRQRFRDAITEGTTFDVETIGKDNVCPLGQWLHGDAAIAHGTLPEYEKVRVAHANFHTQAARLADLVNRHHNQPVLDELAGGSNPFADASTAVNMSLIKLFSIIDPT